MNSATEQVDVSIVRDLGNKTTRELENQVRSPAPTVMAAGSAKAATARESARELGVTH